MPTFYVIKKIQFVDRVEGPYEIVSFWTTGLPLQKDVGRTDE